MSRARDIADQAYIDDDKIQTNLALLAFRTAVNGSGVKFDLQDQVIDEYGNASGIDATPSNNHTLTAGVYSSSGTNVATGGDGGAQTVGDYKVHTFLIGQTGTAFTPATAFDIDYLVVAGGGGGGRGGYGNSGGGGAGGLRSSITNTGGGGSLESDYSATAQAYTITVGVGGAGSSDYANKGVNGGLSSIVPASGGGSIISVGGGGGGSPYTSSGASGGSGGGSGNLASAGGREVNQGFIGGVGAAASNNHPGGGGGGAGAVGQTPASTSANGGTGGVGVVVAITGADVTYAGGGGGSVETGTAGLGGAGGGGAGSSGSSGQGVAGLANTGGGGGSGFVTPAGAGGSGIVVIRYLSATYNDLILQSTDTEAEAQPTKADMVMLIQDAGTGVGTVNTHIKGHISRDSGTTFTEGVLVDEGDWGDDKRILAFAFLHL